MSPSLVLGYAEYKDDFYSLGLTALYAFLLYNAKAKTDFFWFTNKVGHLLFPKGYRENYVL